MNLVVILIWQFIIRHKFLVIDKYHEGRRLHGHLRYIEDLQPLIASGIERGVADACIVLRADKSVPVQYVVNVIDAVNSINEADGTKHKVILATSPKK